VALLARGRTHPDEVFQALEPAHRLAFGTGEVMWEWTVGLRNWALPGAIGGVLWLEDRLGLTTPWALVSGVWLGLSLLQALGCWALYRRVAERDGEGPARLAALGLVTWGGFAIYAARSLSDAVAVPPLLGALLWLERSVRTGRVRDGLSAGGLLGLAVVARYGSVPFVVMAAAWLVSRRAWRALAAVLVGGLAVAGALGALDWATWGEPFHSLLAYVRFNRPDGGVVERFGSKPLWWYAAIAAGMAPVFVAPWVGAGLRRGGLAAVWLVGYGAALHLHPHKEARFLLPLLPLAAAVAAAPLHRWLVGVLTTRRQVAAALGLWAASSVASATVLLPFSLYRALIDGEVECARDAHGMVFAASRNWKGGGRFFVHRDFPVVYANLSGEDAVRAALADPRFDCALVDGSWNELPDLVSSGFTPAWREAEVTVWRRAPR
jgi:hypothetical protein